MIDQGLTTFAEHEDPARSECHAWSASPLYFNMKIVGGIEPLKPGFREVRIAPALGLSSHVKAAIPVPQGMIELDLAKEGEKGIKGVITLPENLKGEFKWQGRTLPLSGGINTIDLR